MGMGQVSVLLGECSVFRMERFITSLIVSSGHYTTVETRLFSGLMKVFFRTCSCYVALYACYLLEYCFRKGGNAAIFFNFLMYCFAEQRGETSHRFATRHGLPGAVGIIDGTPINFAQRPHIDGEVWFSRKQRYSMNLQLVCDDRGKILYYIAGWPGSVYDNTVLNQSPLALQYQDFFLPGQFLLADAGYASTSWCVTPYRNPAAQLPINQVFNELFSSARCRIEHVNGVLKNRFGSLRGLRLAIRTHADFQRVNLWIVVCLLLHNLLTEYEDPWEEEDETDDEEDDDILPQPVGANLAAANNFRTQVQVGLLTWFNERQGVLA